MAAKTGSAYGPSLGLNLLIAIRFVSRPDELGTPNRTDRFVDPRRVNAGENQSSRNDRDGREEHNDNNLRCHSSVLSSPRTAAPIK